MEDVGSVIAELLRRMANIEPKIKGGHSKSSFALYDSKEVLEVADVVARLFGFEVRSVSYVLAAHLPGWLYIQLRDEQIDSNASFEIREVDSELRFSSLVSKVKGVLPEKGVYFEFIRALKRL